MYTMFNGRVSLIRHKLFLRSCSKNTQIISQKQKQKNAIMGMIWGFYFLQKKERKKIDLFTTSYFSLSGDKVCTDWFGKC